MTADQLAASAGSRNDKQRGRYVAGLGTGGIPVPLSPRWNEEGTP